MNIITKNSLKGGAIAIAALLGFSACSDDHYDVFGGDGTSNQTIWQNIVQNPQLKDLQSILTRSYMMRSETDKITPQTAKTLAELLDEPQSFSVWAPIDGTYDAKRYEALLDSAENIYKAEGASKNYLALEYEVANQFVYNHVARFNYEGVSGSQEVILLNGKKVNYVSNGGGSTFNGVGIQGAPIVSSNGTMHLLSTVSPFAFNLYDFLKSSPKNSKLSAYLFDPAIDKYTFSEGRSVEGALNEDGNMVYVDSVYDHTNDILDKCHAQLQNEDSCYVTVVPTDTAWNGAITKLSQYFKYKSTYNYDWSSEKNAFASKTAKLNTDSLTDYNVKASMIQSAFFSPSTWHGISDIRDSAQVIGYALTADSLISTNGTIYYNSSKGGENPMFNNQKPERASNGFVFAVDQYNVQPEYTWMVKRDIEATSQYNMAMQAMASSHCTEKNGSTIMLTEFNRDSVVIDSFNVTSYQRFQRDGRNTLQVDYRLPEVMAASYTVKAVLAPSRICYDIVPDSAVTEVSTFYVEVRDDENKALDIAEGNNGTSAKNKTRSVTFTVDQNEVKEYVIIPRIEFPYSYRGLPADCNTFCRLRFCSEYDRKLTTDGDGLNIVSIKIEPYRGTSEN